MDEGEHYEALGRYLSGSVFEPTVEVNCVVNVVFETSAGVWVGYPLCTPRRLCLD